VAVRLWKREVRSLLAEVVCYDPDKHARATLTPGRTLWPLAGLTVCILLSLFAALSNTEEGRHILSRIGINF
jgi:hypothetical protein